MIANEASPDANVIWGVAFDNELEDEMKITIIATGFEKKPGDDERNAQVKAKNAPAARTSTFVKTVVSEPDVNVVAENNESVASATEVKAAPKATASSSDKSFADDDFMKMMEEMFGTKKK